MRRNRPGTLFYFGVVGFRSTIKENDIRLQLLISGPLTTAYILLYTRDRPKKELLPLYRKGKVSVRIRTHSSSPYLPLCTEPSGIP